MANITCEFHGTRSGLIDLIHRIGAGVAGDPSTGIPADMVRGVHLRMAVTLMSQVNQAFITKSRGGMGSDGIIWKPLSPATIAARRTSATERRSLGIGGKRERGLLSPAQNKRWKSIFGGRLAKFVLQGMSEGAAKALAAKIAWAVLKGEGAQTKLQVLGSRKVDIGRDTGILFRSLAPGIGGGSVENQVMDVSVPGQFTVGTNVPYAARFHAVRPLWPDHLPPAWAEAVNGAAARGVANVLAQMLGGSAT